MIMLLLLLLNWKQCGLGEGITCGPRPAVNTTYKILSMVHCTDASLSSPLLSSPRLVSQATTPYRSLVLNTYHQTKTMRFSAEIIYTLGSNQEGVNSQKSLLI